MVGTYISDAMRAAEGSRLSLQVSYPISESDVRRWAVAVYYPEPPPPCFWDVERAGRRRHGRMVAPHEFNPFAWMVALSEPPASPLAISDIGWLEKLVEVEPPPVRFGVGGGIEVVYGEPMCVGDVITADLRLGEYDEREGSLGLMLFARRTATWTNEDGAMVKTITSTLIRY